MVPSSRICRNNWNQENNKAHPSGCAFFFVINSLTAPADPSGSGEFTMDLPNPLDLALGRKALVEAVLTEVTHSFTQRIQPLPPALDPALPRLSVFRRQVCAQANYSFQRDRLRHHVIIVAPRLLEYL